MPQKGGLTRMQARLQNGVPPGSGVNQEGNYCGACRANDAGVDRPGFASLNASHRRTGRNLAGIMATLMVAFLFLWPAAAKGQAIVVDHTSLPLFDQIPEQYLEAARNLRFLFMDRSVGVNTHEALDCLTASSYGQSAPSCRRDFQFVNGAWQLTLRDQASYDAGQVPAYIRFTPSPTRYNRSRWRFYWFAETWDRMTSDFVSGLHNLSIPALVHPTGESVSVNPLDFDVISFQFSYLNVENGSTILDFFSRRPGSYDDAHDLEREIGEHLTSATPRRVFVYFTSSLARSIGTQVSADFNARMRQWCRETNCILFDFADIESHDMAGRPCYDDRDGVPYTHPNNPDLSENFPDDGLDIPAICQEKTTEVVQGHLSTAQGRISIAKGLWVLLARIAGWNPEVPPSVPAAPTNLRVIPGS